MNSLVVYMFLGASLAAPIGPVKTVLLNTGIKRGFFHAWAFSLGSVAADILYMFIVYFGVGQFIESPLIKIILWSFGCFVLLYTGIENLLTLNKVEMSLKFGKRVRLRTSMLTGFLMSLMNPLTIIFWLGIYGSILAKTAGGSTGYQIILNSGAIMLGIIIVDVMMACLSSGARKFLSVRLLIIVTLISSLSMIGFGLYFGIQAYQALF
ncbi:amino acid transporter [Sporosarcina sp. P2]|uniref:LysE family transporter n=1 Tax=unclassified Sporosarcina TaxID=2647733 RepID=UPI000C173870|nr:MULTISPECIES: LysE family transporter [unclassified Sporosarcina]PID02488.1 amino acid transporter [Sporosarcina sp. P2]PID13909.1 amino acid transporter [Sporosarcina sp. P34]